MRSFGLSGRRAEDGWVVRFLHCHWKEVLSAVGWGGDASEKLGLVLLLLGLVLPFVGEKKK